DFFFQGLNTPR
nr:RecName: Full=Germin-like protein 4 [Betula pendula]